MELLEGIVPIPYDRFEVVTENYASCKDFVWWYGKEEPSQIQQTLWLAHGVPLIFAKPYRGQQKNSL